MIEKIVRVEKIQMLGGRRGQIYKNFFQSGEGDPVCLFVFYLSLFFKVFIN